MQWSRSPGKKGSHFDPKSDLFVPNEAKDVMTSTACWTAMLATLVGLTFIVGPLWMLKLYVVPYWVITQTSSEVGQIVQYGLFPIHMLILWCESLMIEETC